LKRASAKKIFVLGLDGVPYSFIKQAVGAGDLPNLAGLIAGRRPRKMRSVLPTVSSVAWTTYATGVNPARHGLFGFVDRRADPFQVFIPTSAQVKHPTLWQVLSRAGKRVVAINVPISYPPWRINGVCVGCFLTPSLDKGVHPAELAPELRARGYLIDVDAWKAREDLRGFVGDLHRGLDRRFEVALWLSEREEWDLFQLHIMGTDRINHFLWSAWENDDPQWREPFMDFYRRVDYWIGRLIDRLGMGMTESEAELLVLSDHGFCSVKKEFNVNRWLEDKGHLKMALGGERKIQNYHRETRAYSLIPGRIFINLAGREERGSVKPGREYEALRQRLIDELSRMRDPETNAPVVRKVHLREDLYDGPFLEQAADLILEPEPGYDPKAGLDGAILARPGAIRGMHTLDDAFVMADRQTFPEGELQISDLMPWILKQLGLEPSFVIPACFQRESMAC
jgi:predicted AlkP superfamily phosphohydrolase/phosphomutase